MKITIPYKPREWSKPFHDTDKRWIVLVIHRRAGKTTAAINHLQRSALTVKNSRYAYIAPTYKQAKNIAWDVIKQYAQVIPGVEYNEAELTVRYPNGSRITLYGADNPDSLRGIGLWGVVFDEYSQQPSNIFTEIIRPALADHSGYAIWIGTPKGKNEFFKLYEHARKEEDWYSALLTVDDTKVVARSEIDDAQKIMTEDEFQQEWYCSFEAAIQGAYYSRVIAKARKEKRIKEGGVYDPSLPVFTITDLGTGRNLATGFYQKLGLEVRMIDFWQGINSDGLPELAVMLQNRGYVYGKHFAPHDIKATEQGTGKSKLETAGKLGIKFELIPNIGLENGIKAGQLMFNRLWVDESKPGVAYWLDAISQYKQRWDEKKGMFIEEPYHDWTSHPADVHRYAAVVEDKMTNNSHAEQLPRQHVPESRYEGTVPVYPQSDDISDQELAKM